MSQRRCVCSGIRSCLSCESKRTTDDIPVTEEDDCLTFIYCISCGDKAFVHRFSDHSNHCRLEEMTEWRDFVAIDGVFVKTDVIDDRQESQLMAKIDSIEWFDSQSGRRKQDFGPKVNFKRRKVKCNHFSGLPQFDIELLATISEQMADKAILEDFIAVEVCHLEYNPLNGSAIDPHFDDFWLWGRRLVTVNLLSSTVLTLETPEDVKTDNRCRIRVDLPKRSLIVLSGDSRYKYWHSIRRQDIRRRRIAITYRELSEEFLPNGSLYESTGKEIIALSMNELIFH